MRSRAGDSRARARVRETELGFFFSSEASFSCRVAGGRRHHRARLLVGKREREGAVDCARWKRALTSMRKFLRRASSNSLKKKKKKWPAVASFVLDVVKPSWRHSSAFHTTVAAVAGGGKNRGARAASSTTPRLGCGFVIVIIGALAVGPIPYACVTAPHR